MPAMFGGTPIGAMQYGGTPIAEAMIDGQIVYRSIPTVSIVPGPEWNSSQIQFRQACIDYGTTYDTVQVLPFKLDTSTVVSMNSMFSDCTALTTIPPMDTSNVTDMASLFRACTSLIRVPQMDTSKVTQMRTMFNSCNSLVSVPDLDAGAATDMSSMFSNCHSLTSAPSLSNAHGVTSMRSMFYNCYNLTSVPDLIASNVTTTLEMFRLCSALTDGNVRLIGKHLSVDTKNMILSSGLTREPFYTSDGTPIIVPIEPTFLDAAPWIELPTVEGVTYTVDGTPGAGASVTVTATAEDGYELEGTTQWTHTYGPAIVHITDPGGIFGIRNSLRDALAQHGHNYQTATEIPFILDISQVTRLGYMFDGMGSLEVAPPLSTAHITEMNYMFLGCGSLTYVPDMDTAAVTTANGMFIDTSSLTDGNVRLIGRHPNLSSSAMLNGSALTRQPFYDTNGNPI